MNTIHKAKAFSCTECSFTASMENRMLDHVHTHTAKKFKCASYDMQLATRSALRKHTLLHLSVEEHKCPIVFLILWSRRLYTWRNAKLRGANLLHRNLLQMPKTTGDAERGIESVSPVYFMNLMPSVYFDTFVMKIFKHLLCSFIMSNRTYQVYGSAMQKQ